MKTIVCIDHDGNVFEPGSQAACVCYPVFHGVRYAPLGARGSKKWFFVAITDEQWRQIQESVEARGGALVGVS